MKSSQHQLARPKEASLVVVVLLSTMLLGVSTDYGQSSCRDNPLNDVSSPDGRHTAVVIGRTCGKAAGFSTKVSIFTRGKTESHFVGNALIVDINPGDFPAPSGPGGGPVVEVQWISSNELRLTYHTYVKVWKAATSVDGIRIDQVRQWQ